MKSSAGIAVRDQLRGVKESRVVALAAAPAFELRSIPNGSGGENLRFTGVASVTGVPYEMEDAFGAFDEVISRGAFKKTLSESADVAFLIGHEGLPLARTGSGTMRLSEETDPSTAPVFGTTGLYVEALLDPQNPYVQTVRSAVERGDFDQMSMAFRAIKQRWSPDYSRRDIDEISLAGGDVSIVTFAANPHTAGSIALRQKFPRRDTADGDACARCLGEREVILQGQRVKCPLCKGTGGGENNADAAEANAASLAAARNSLAQSQDELAAYVAGLNARDAATLRRLGDWDVFIEQCRDDAARTRLRLEQLRYPPPSE